MGTAGTSPAGVRGGGHGPSRLLAGHSLFLRAPGDVVRACGCVILVDQLLHDLPGVVQLIEVVLEDVLLAELLQEGLSLAQLVVLPARPLKQLGSSAGSGGQSPLPRDSSQEKPAGPMGGHCTRPEPRWEPPTPIPGFMTGPD